MCRIWCAANHTFEHSGYQDVNCCMHHSAMKLRDDTRDRAAMSKKCTPLWHEAHLEVKMYRTPGDWTTFSRLDGDSMSRKCTPLWREAHLEIKSVKDWWLWVNLGCFDVTTSKIQVQAQVHKYNYIRTTTSAQLQLQRLPQLQQL